MVTVKLLGAPTCRRYQKMRVVVLSVADRLGLQVNLVEVSELEALTNFNPLSLPRLYIDGALVATQNPPKVKDIEHILAGKS